MVIRTSRAGEVERLVAALGDERGRDAAVARLRVIGTRAFDRLSALILDAGAPAAARAAALKVLDGSEDPRSLDLALTASAADDAEVVVAAVTVLRGWLTRERGARALDALTGAALATARDSRIRLAALDALSELPRDMVAPVLLQAQPVERRATDDDPVAAREWLAAHQDAPLSELHDFVVEARRREKSEASARRRHDWLIARAAAHAALARRDSRVALYDLRETFDAAAAPLPLDFLVAIIRLGDASCLEPMARAWHAAPDGETWWRERLADAAADIMHRTRLSGRSAVVKRIRTKWSGFL